MMANNKILTILIIVLLTINVALYVSLEREKDLSAAYRDEVTNVAGMYFQDSINENDCTPLGFCVGDEFTSNAEAKRFGINASGNVIMVSDGLITYDETGNEDWNQIDEIWIKHIKIDNSARLDNATQAKTEQITTISSEVQESN